MSRLRELRLHGFKSFADPTRFVFEPGVNAVIGPNGSGKSNMADAVRWVLGEQSNRSLRTRRADDVIFAGSDGRKAQGMAEAIMTLDNADGWLPIDFAEVSVGRRAYRSGESEYLINGARARLRDVVELLAAGRLGANELVVVGQGTVDAALSLRPEERRQLFEEAAGVKGLQVRRNEATTRLLRARDNLTRVADLVGELKPQVRRLALQAEHQQQHDALGRRAMALVAESHRRREASARAALGDARRAAAGAEAAVEAVRAEQAQSRDRLAQAEERYWSAESAARDAGRAREATRETLIRAEGRADAVTLRRQELAAGLTAAEAELAGAEADLASLESGPADARVAPAVAAAAEAEEAWRAAVNALAEADEELLAAEEALAELRRRESERIASDARVAEDVARADARRAAAEAERQAAQSAVTDARTALDAARGATADAQRSLQAAQAALDAAAAVRDAAQTAADTARQRRAELRERLGAATAELDALSEPTDGVQRLAATLAGAGWASLLDAIEPPADAWRAIEAVVGGELDAALLWRDDAATTAALDGARGAARLLDAGVDAGDADGRVAALRAVDGSRTLSEWIGAAAVPRALRRTVVARDVEALLAGWRRLPPGWCAVTADGDLADERGMLILRGRADAAGGATAERHARRRVLGEAIPSLTADEADASTSMHAAAEALRAARDRHLAVRDAAEEAERVARRARGDEDTARAELERAEEALERAEADIAELPGAGDGPSVVARAAGGELRAFEARAAEARARREAAAGDRDRARDAWGTVREAAAAIEKRTAAGRSERVVLGGRVAQLRIDVPARRAALDALDGERADADAALAAAKAADATAMAARDAADRTREDLRAQLLDLERQGGGGVSRLAELERAAQASAIEASRREDALAALARERELALEGLPEGLEDGADETLVEEMATLDDDALDVEVRRVRRTLAQIGSVNPFAVEEHRELAARLEEMSTQDDDLRGAIGSTEELIARLDAEISEQFDAAFRSIGERFDEYCRLLFDGGSASLQMADEADGDAPGGIEIVVRPPGKRLQRLAMLSGGERALTGVALLFAMLSVNPVPFCILDEVDAALDEANIGRFADALRRLAETIDFVVITHNRATIEVADTIYGVTMTDAAVSRVLSLRLADVPAEVSA